MRSALKISLALTAILLAPVIVLAEIPHGILDQAGIFSPQSLEKSRSLIERIYQRNDLGIFVETLPIMPQTLVKKMNRGRISERGKLIKSFAQERAEELRVDGMYILISTDPDLRFVEVFSSPGGIVPFSESACNQIRIRIQATSKTKTFNSTLPEALAKMDSQLASAKNDLSDLWVYLPLVFIGIICMWLVTLFYRDRNSGDTPSSPGNGNSAKELPHMLGVVGTPANQWIYDKALLQITSGL